MAKNLRDTHVISVRDALSIYENHDYRVKKFKILLIVALALPVLFIIGSIIWDKFLIIYPFAVIALYIVSGVFIKVLGSVLGTAKKIAFWGWLLVPIPFNLVIFFISLGAAIGYAFLALLILPAIPMYSKWKEIQTEYKTAIDILYENGLVDRDGERVTNSNNEDSSGNAQSKMADDPRGKESKSQPKQTGKKPSLKLLEHTEKKCPNCSSDYLNIMSNGTIKVYLCPSCKKKYKYKE